MTLAQIVQGAAVFLDANIFVYHFSQLRIRQYLLLPAETCRNSLWPKDKMERVPTKGNEGVCSMPDLILENVPQELYDDLRQAAESKQRSVAEEALERLKLNHSRLHLPDEPFLTEETPAPCTIPLPGEGKPVQTRMGERHLPDPPWITTADR
jgi:hypothetical protein